jgi:hypothetical protein
VIRGVGFLADNAVQAEPPGARLDSHYGMPQVSHCSASGSIAARTMAKQRRARELADHAFLGKSAEHLDGWPETSTMSRCLPSKDSGFNWDSSMQMPHRSSSLRTPGTIEACC